MTVTADDRFRQLLEEARADPAVVGLVLGGSRGKGFETAGSDYDLYLILRDDASGRRDHYAAQYPPPISITAYTLGEFSAHAEWGSPTDWDRYGLARAPVLLDKNGRIAPLVAAKGRVPDDQRLPLVREALDAYLNSLYRSAKCWRNGDRLGARLEAADSLGHLLTVIFALEGRHRPYYGYLARELRACPLAAFPLESADLLARIGAIADGGDLAAQQGLLGTVERVCRAAGCGDVFAAWGVDYPWMKTYRPGGWPGTGLGPDVPAGGTAARAREPDPLAPTSRARPGLEPAYWCQR